MIQNSNLGFWGIVMYGRSSLLIWGLGVLGVLRVLGLLGVLRVLGASLYWCATLSVLGFTGFCY